MGQEGGLKQYYRIIHNAHKNRKENSKGDVKTEENPSHKGDVE